LPVCDQHPGSRIVKNGTYGSGHEKRQAFRCYPSDSEFHKFAGAVPRLVAEGHSCDHCENPVASHQGPRVAHRYDFPVTQAADALVMVGQGVSYTETADRIRARNRHDRFERGSQLVQNWVEVLGPVVGEEYAETEWPETVVLDSTWFTVTNQRTRVTTQAFAVLGVHGYPSGTKSGRSWALRASPNRRAPEWEKFLRSLRGAPTLVICDGDVSILAAVARVWPTAFVKRCEHHLRERAKLAMGRDGLDGYGTPEMGLLGEAFHSPHDWTRFKRGVRGKAIDEWVRQHDLVLTVQVKSRASLPQHHSTGAIDPELGRIRDFMDPRAFCYRNAERTTRMLDLVRLRLNRCDDPLVYARAIRAHLDANGGKLGRQGVIMDPLGQPSLR
jgi:hypothetical protein